MISQYIEIGNNDWRIVVFYDVCLDDLDLIRKNIIRAGNSRYKTEEAIKVLSNQNTGYTFTNYDERMSVIVISHATSAGQLFDTYDHELKHVVEHISDYYDVSPKSEEAAYLQGEIARQMFSALAMVVCPKCHSDYRRNVKLLPN